MFLALSGGVDLLYYYGPGRGSVSGGWFDLLWSLMLMVPLLISATWTSTGHRKPTRAEPVHAGALVLAQLLPLLYPALVLVMSAQLLPLLYPALVLVMSAQIAQKRIAVAFVVIALSFVCSSARLIVTQLRQQQSTQEVRRSCSLLAAVAEGTSDAIFVKDRSGRYLMINGAGAQMIGKTVAEVIGRTDLELFSPESGRAIMDGDRRVIDSGNTQTYEDVGTAAGVTRTYLSTKGPYRDAEGNIIGLIGIAVDITSRKRSEEALQRQALAMEASDDGMAILNARGEYVYVNSAYARIFGLENPEHLIGRNWRFLYQADEVERFERHILPVMRFEGRWQGEALGLKQDGRVFPQELGLTALQDGGLISVCRDISDRRRVQEQLARSQRMEAIGRFAGGIAHDFNNLLTVIRGYSHLALGDLRDEQTVESCAERIERIENAADRAAALTRQLLAFSRQQVLQPETIHLNDLVVNLGKMLHRLIGEDIEILTETDASLGLIKADPTQMEQVIMNLVLNARDAMPQGGRLTLETANVDIDHADPRNHAGVPPGPYVTLAVSDSGLGMDPETQSHIFEPFFTTKESGKGTGLGLSTVYGIVQQSDGYISFSSELQRGTTFRIYLPRTSNAAPVTTSPYRSLTIGRGDETILLVEDDQQVRQLAQSVLTSCGYSVLAPESALEALPLCAQHSNTIHLLLTDVVMPGMSGCELAKQVVGTRPTTRVLYMSGYRDNPAVGDCLLDAGTFFLEKPFTPALLAYKVREALDRN
jgi:two-component system, cell cycle sensor histidine kinase and response regulator CckA